MKKIFIGIDFSKEKFDVVIIMAENLEEKAPSHYLSIWSLQLCRGGPKQILALQAREIYGLPLRQTIPSFRQQW